ncbi:MAG: hypothetical protein Q4P36_06575 [Bowdeniella nasicola]|nr:hypothetical protein [Bowdeniella nasicola]
MSSTLTRERPQPAVDGTRAGWCVQAVAGRRARLPRIANCMTPHRLLLLTVLAVWSLRGGRDLAGMKRGPGSTGSYCRVAAR